MPEVVVADVVAEVVAAVAADAARLEAVAARPHSADPAAAVRALPLDRTLDRPLDPHSGRRTAAELHRSADPAEAAAPDLHNGPRTQVAAALAHLKGPRTDRVAVVATTAQVVRAVWAIVRVAARATVLRPAI